jgi:hypothetical protein
MRDTHDNKSLIVAAAVALVVIGMASCATVKNESRLPQRLCKFTVTNRTPNALEIRRAQGYSMRSIGALNPGELLTDDVPCSERYVLIRGIEIPMQVGAALNFGYVQAWADLHAGAITPITLHWP